MKFKHLIFTTLLGASFLFYNCSGCDNENPTARVSNAGTDKVSVQIKTSGGNTENINNVDPGTLSNATSYAPGQVTYTIVLKDNTEVVETVNMEYCTDYIVTIDQNNIIKTTSTERD